MSNHRFTFYSATGEFLPAATDHLVIEVAAHHFACMVVKENKHSIDAFELFNFSKGNEKSLEEILNEVFLNSSIVKSHYAGIHIYFNDEYCIPVPVMHFDDELAADYLNAVVGEDYNCDVFTEYLTVMPGIVNVFRVSKSNRLLLEQKFHGADFHHSNTVVIKRMMSNVSESGNDIVGIHFFYAFFKVCVMKEGEFNLIQSFEYETPNDVVYHLLNMKQRLELPSSLVLQVSGLIETDFQIYRELIKYFKNIVFDDFVSAAIPDNNGNMPAYYFSPFLNLAV